MMDIRKEEFPEDFEHLLDELLRKIEARDRYLVLWAGNLDILAEIVRRVMLEDPRWQPAGGVGVMEKQWTQALWRVL